jgi:Asp-tRNA(Asn)/Glu-tRNA(Gln) amidotransferase B subunit
MISSGDLSSRGAKDVLVLLLQNKGTSPRTLAESNNLIQKSDDSTIVPIIEKILLENPDVVASYKSGKTALLQFFIGQAMKVTKGSANPEIVKKLLLEKLG